MITFHYVQWSNFLSTGNNQTKIVLDEHKTTLVCGRNGSGKSTIMDAIAFALYNKPFRKINKPQLVNSINNKKLVVEIEFTTAGSRWKVVRGIKPTIFRIYKDGNLLEQDAQNRDQQEFLEKQVIKMSFKTFLQIVILGSANWTAFMSLKSADRRRVIEDLLDIEVFSIMNQLLKERVSKNKDNQIILDKHLAILENTLQLNQSHRQQQQNQQKEWIDSKQQTIEQKIEDNQNLAKQTEKLSKKIDTVVEKLEQYQAVDYCYQQKINDIQTLRQKFARGAEQIQFYGDNDTCPTCTQQIDQQFKDTAVDKLTEKQQMISDAIDRITKLTDDLAKQKEQRDSVNKQLKKLQDEQSDIHLQTNINNKLIQSIREEIVQLTNTNVDFVDDTETKKSVKQAKAAAKKLSNQRELYNQAQRLLKDDGIKTHIIQQYIPIMNTLINKYLERMDFFCKFEIDENFNEQIETLHKQVFTYDSFSEGEKMRIDLSLLFTWREISRMRNTSPCNILILDEIMDSSLDQEGTDEFVNIIKQLTGDNNVIIISHKTDQISDKFDRILEVEKHKNFSRIKRS